MRSIVHLFTNYIISIDKNRFGINYQTESWREALESKDFKLSWTKTEYMWRKFSIEGK